MECVLFAPRLTAHCQIRAPASIYLNPFLSFPLALPSTRARMCFKLHSVHFFFFPITKFLLTIFLFHNSQFTFITTSYQFQVDWNFLNRFTRIISHFFRVNFFALFSASLFSCLLWESIIFLTESSDYLEYPVGQKLVRQFGGWLK